MPPRQGRNGSRHLESVLSVSLEARGKYRDICVQGVVIPVAQTGCREEVTGLPFKIALGLLRPETPRRPLESNQISNC